MLARIGALTGLVVGVGIFSVASLAQQPAQPAAPKGAKDGKSIFLENRCNSCHTIQAQAITRKKVEGEDEDKEKDKKKPPDLSSVGLERKAPWMQKFLMKQETIDGEHHRKKFKGSEQDLQTLTAWLETLKAPKKGSK